MSEQDKLTIVLKGMISHRCEFVAHKCRRCGEWLIAPPDLIATVYKRHLVKKHKLYNVEVIADYEVIQI